MKKLFRLRLIILLAIFALNSCSKDDYQGIKEEKKIMVLSKNKIENVEIENNIIKTLSKIKQVFEINAPKSYKKNVLNRSANDSINLNEITINTEAYNTIEDQNGKISYVFEIKYPSENIEKKEIINLNYFYDENNILQNQLIKYDLTQSELETIKINNSYDGFLENISYIDLSRGCPCQGGGTPIPVWVPYPNYSGYGGTSPSVPYILPPLSTLPPQVMAALLAAGAIYSTNPSFIPGGNPSYTFPIQYFSVNDLTIPAPISSNPAIPFNNFNTYYFSNIKDIIKNYYESTYVSGLGSYITSSQTALADHIVKQKFIYDFFIYRYFLEQSNTSAFNYLASSPERIETIFNFLQKNKAANGSISFSQKYIVNQLLNYLVINPTESDSATTELYFKALSTTNNFQNDLDENFILNNITYFSQDVQNQILIDPLLAAQIAQEYLIQRTVKRTNHPNWNEVQIYYSVLWDLRHFSLDALGLVPLFGEVADLTNGLLYTIEGDGLNATLSYASAIPIVGWASFSTKYALKITTTLTGKTKLVWKITNGLIEFGNRGQLRKVLNLAVGNPLVAHHIIPWAQQGNQLIQRAAKSANAFHMNEALNGIPLSTAVHNGSHTHYDNIIIGKMDNFIILNPNATPDACYNQLMIIIQQTRTAILNNPNTPINLLNF